MQSTDGLAALQVAYADVAGVAVSLDEQDSWQASGCAGWAMRDLVFHLLGDAQRALVALGTPVPGPADRDAVSYWTDAPSGDDPDSRGLRATRTMASAYRLDHLTGTYAETARAVLSTAAHVPAESCIATQGHVLRVEDLLVTLTVEAGIHHLDLVAHLDRPGPSELPLGLVRRTLDGLLGRPAPSGWDDTTWALVGTGRRPPNAVERQALGADADRLPLLH